MPISRGRGGYAEFSVSPMHVEAVRESFATNESITNRRISRPNIAGFARKTGNPWMNDMRGIELGTSDVLDLFRPYRPEGIYGIDYPGLCSASTRAITWQAFGPSNFGELIASEVSRGSKPVMFPSVGL